MRPSPIPDDEMFAGHQRVTFSKPEGEEFEEVLPVEVQATIDEEMGLPMMRVRIELEPGDAERLAAGEPFWLTFWGHMPIFDVAMVEPIVEDVCPGPACYGEGDECYLHTDADDGRKLVRLWCGHERWAPLDWDGKSPMTCHECIGFDRQGEPPLRDVVEVG